MLLFAVTLTDPQLPQTTPFSTFYATIHIFVTTGLQMTNQPLKGYGEGRGLFKVTGSRVHCKFGNISETCSARCNRFLQTTNRKW